jgi:hypothetical protein
VALNGNIKACPVADGISANPSDVAVGFSVALAIAAHDSDSDGRPGTRTAEAGDPKVIPLRAFENTGGVEHSSSSFLSMPLRTMGLFARRMAYLPDQTVGFTFVPVVSPNHVGAGFALSF